MTDSEINYLTMARVAYRELTDGQPQWQPLAPAMQADYALLGQQLDTARTLAVQQSQHSTKGYTDAKDRAEHEAEEAAGRLVRGLRAVLLDRRNAAWSAWLAERLARPGTVFVAVGAGHLAGRESVQAKLKAQGLTVSRIE